MIYFVGAGPGDVDLITIKGRRLLEDADIIIYAGSLVSDEHLKFAKSDCKFFNSASMTLDEVIEIMKENPEKKIVRLHTGDPSIYGAIREQMDELDLLNIPYEIVPGVSSFTAAAAAIKKEFTLPNVSQTVILTRMAGRTPVPEGEDILSLAKHRASMAIFLSVKNIDKLTEELIAGYGTDEIPVAVVYKASWEDERVIYGTLKDIAKKVKAENITKTAQILVGGFIEGDYEKSRLYSPTFSHEFRRAKSDE